MPKKIIKNPKKMYEKIALMCGNFDMPYYQRVLLVSMVYRKAMNPQEKISEIIDKVTDNGSMVAEIYKKNRKKTCMRISSARELQYLEQFLHDCKDVPENH